MNGLGRTHRHRRSGQGLRRARLLRLGALLLALIGATLLIVGSCSGRSGPPQPAADAAGTISPQAPTAAPPPASSSLNAPAGTAQPTAPSSAPTATASAAPPTALSSPLPSPPAGISATTPQRSAAQSLPPQPTIVVPSFSVPPVKGPVLQASPPVSITIPAIKVSASLMDLGLNPDGSIQVPPLDVPNSEPGWYTGSPTPGTLGPAIILGHVDSAKYGPAVFYDLGALVPGDTLSITTKDRTVAVFRIDAVRTYTKNQFPTKEIYGNLNYAGLRLITCGGTFNPQSGHYESNTVAFASLISSHPQ